MDRPGDRKKRSWNVAVPLKYMCIGIPFQESSLQGATDEEWKAILVSCHKFQLSCCHMASLTEIAVHKTSLSFHGSIQNDRGMESFQNLMILPRHVELEQFLQSW